ncbi:MAG: DNA recombination protein RmuC [Acidiferrobacterales bacterium]|nr:DNA recombination protein RmuC [Acidiferrobacterales bacterium]
MQVLTDPFFVLGFVLILAWVSFVLLRRSSARNSHDDRFDLLEQITEKLAAQERVLTGLLDQRLERTGIDVRQTLEKTSQETSVTLGDLRQRLGEITVYQGKITDLSTRVNRLHEVLASTKHKGIFGEQQLADIIRNVLPAQSYEFQSSLSNARRADLILKLPNPPGSICVDSKFPLQSFQDIQDARETKDVDGARRKFKTAVRKHIVDIANKYIVAGETSEFALMFVPSEAIFAEIQDAHQDLVKESHDARVYIVSPTTMMATVTAIRGIVRDAELSHQAQQVREVLLKVAVEVEKLDELAKKLQKNFDRLQGDVSRITRRTHSVRERIDVIGDAHREEETGQDGSREPSVQP